MPIDDLVLASVDDNLGNTCAIDVNDTIEFNNIFLSTSTDDGDDDYLSSDYSCVSSGNTIENIYHLEVDEVHFARTTSKGLTKNECPATICIATSIGAAKSRRLLKVLLDSGWSQCLIKKSALPNRSALRQLAEKNLLTH